MKLLFILFNCIFVFRYLFLYEEIVFNCIKNFLRFNYVDLDFEIKIYVI